jgi:phosphatidylglycerol---prolipoprotein diacylglyceryl transferase
MLGWRVIPRIGIGRFTISPHGLGIAVGYFVGTLLMLRRVRKRGLNEDDAWNAAAIAVIGAIVGARAAYILGHHSDFTSPIQWLQVYKGGISLFGGFIGGFGAAALYLRKKTMSFIELADMGAPGIALGTAIGRIGDLMIGDHLGKQTSGWWGWRYKGGELISFPRCVYNTPDKCIRPGMVVHQTALYDLLWSLMIFGILIYLEKKPRRIGFLITIWAALYTSGRILTDFTRVDEHWFGTGLTGSQLTAAVVLLACLVSLVKNRTPRVKTAGLTPDETSAPTEKPPVPSHLPAPAKPADESVVGPPAAAPEGPVTASGAPAPAAPAPAAPAPASAAAAAATPASATPAAAATASDAWQPEGDEDAEALLSTPRGATEAPAGVGVPEQDLAVAETGEDPEYGQEEAMFADPAAGLEFELDDLLGGHLNESEERAHDEEPGADDAGPLSNPEEI